MGATDGYGGRWSRARGGAAPAGQCRDMVGPAEGMALGRPDRAGPDLRRGPRLQGPCALSGHRFTVGIDVRVSQLFAQVLDAKFAPHPGEEIGSASCREGWLQYVSFW